MNKKHTIAIIGAGHVCHELSFFLAISHFCDEVIISGRNENHIAGMIRNLQDGSSFCHLAGLRYAPLSDVKQCNIIIITASVHIRKMVNRSELKKQNQKIIKSIIPTLAENNPDAIFIIITNPADVMTYSAIKLSGFPPERIIGIGTMVDTERAARLISDELKIHPDSVTAVTLGQHGETTFLSRTLSNVEGISLSQVMHMMGHQQFSFDLMDEEIRKVGWEIYKKIKYTSYGVAICAKKLVGSIVSDEKKIHTVSTMINNYYGINEICLSLPCVIGKNGIEKIFYVELDSIDQEKLIASSNFIKSDLSDLSF